MRENTANPELLSERSAEVLRGVIESYFATGTPVGSRTIVERWVERWNDAPCSATVRHSFCELEDAGYLAQPHTSAGRVPTAKAICWWLQALAAPQPLAHPVGERYAQAMIEAGEPSRIWQTTSEFLAEITGQLAVVAVQPSRDRGLKHLRFFRLTEHRVLAIWVGTDGQVRERVSRVPEAYSQTDLDAAARYLNANFCGMTLAGIRRELMKRVEEERAAYDALLKRVLVLSHCGVLTMQDDGQVYVRGTDHLAMAIDAEKLGEVLARLNQKERWLHLLSEAGSHTADTVSWHAPLAGDGGVLPQRWIHVRVGLAEEALPDFSLITTACAQGTVAILGPQRMPYPTVLGAVTLAGEMLHKCLEDASA